MDYWAVKICLFGFQNQKIADWHQYAEFSWFIYSASIGLCMRAWLFMICFIPSQSGLLLVLFYSSWPECLLKCVFRLYIVSNFLVFDLFFIQLLSLLHLLLHLLLFCLLPNYDRWSDHKFWHMSAPVTLTVYSTQQSLQPPVPPTTLIMPSHWLVIFCSQLF